MNGVVCKALRPVRRTG